MGSEQPIADAEERGTLRISFLQSEKKNADSLKVRTGSGEKIHCAEFMAWADEGSDHIPAECRCR